MTNDNPQVKVGDKLAFSYGYSSGQYHLREVIKITPSGRIVCEGGLTLDPDLRIRGPRGFHDCLRGEIVTEELLKEIKVAELRKKLIARILNRWGQLRIPNLPTDCLIKLEKTLHDLTEKADQ